MANVTHARPAPVKRAGAGRFTRQERLAYTMLVPILGSIFLIVTYPFVLAVIQSPHAPRRRPLVVLQTGDGATPHGPERLGHGQHAGGGGGPEERARTR